MRIAILALLLFLPVLGQEPGKAYVNPAYNYSFEYPADFEMTQDAAKVREFMDLSDTAEDEIQPHFLLFSPAGAMMMCITTPLSEAHLAVPTIELARVSLKEAILTIPGSKVLSDPAETAVGGNLLVRYELEVTAEGESPARQVQYMVRNSELRVLYLFGVTADSANFPTDVLPFETILKGLKLDFATGVRVQG